MSVTTERPAQAGGSGGSRLFLLDLLKAIGCVLIVWHHLTVYGPMSDVVYPFAPDLFDWLYEQARMVVQVFLVVGGFLAAAQLAPNGAPQLTAPPGALILRRYKRLAVPLLAALVLAVTVTAAVRPWFNDPSLSGVPDVVQLLAHLLLLQDLVGAEALSAGVWYVAIDFQLYAMVVLLAWGVLRLVPRGRSTTPMVALVAVLALLSLFWWNRVEALDVTALYFWGAYGLGALAYLVGRSAQPWRWIGPLVACGGAALMLEWRPRVAVALVTALGLVLAGLWRRHASERSEPPSALRAAIGGLARISYSVFLVHYAVVLLSNAVVSELWPGQPLMNALGMAVAFGLSLLAGQLMHVLVESRPATPRRVLTYQAALLLSGMAVLTLEAGL